MTNLANIIYWQQKDWIIKNTTNPVKYIKVNSPPRIYLEMSFVDILANTVWYMSFPILPIRIRMIFYHLVKYWSSQLGRTYCLHSYLKASQRYSRTLVLISKSLISLVNGNCGGGRSHCAHSQEAEWAESGARYQTSRPPPLSHFHLQCYQWWELSMLSLQLFLFVSPSRTGPVLISLLHATAPFSWPLPPLRFWVWRLIWDFSFA